MTLSRAHRMTIFATAGWGFLSLLLTEQFNPWLLLGCLAAVILGYFFASQNPSKRILHWNLLTLLVSAVAFVQFFRSPLDTVMHFFMYLQIAKLYTSRSYADTLWIHVLAFFQIVGAAVLTNSLSFAFVFLGYILLVTCSLVLLTICREIERNDNTLRRIRASWAKDRFASFISAGQASAPAPATSDPPFGLRWAYSTAFISFLIFVTSMSFFFVIPRLSTQRLFANFGETRPTKTSSSAFDDTVEFGTFEKIQLDPSVAMYVQQIGGIQCDYVRLRATALDNFDGQRWRRTTQSANFQPTEPLLHPGPFNRANSPVSAAFLIVQPPGVTSYLFADTFPEAIALKFYKDRVNFDFHSQSFWLPKALPKEIQYEATSRRELLTERRDPTKLFPRSKQDGSTSISIEEVNRVLKNPRLLAGKVFPESASARPRSRLAPSLGRRWEIQSSQYIQRCLQLPDSINKERVRALADEWTADAKTPFQRTIAIERVLRTRYEYTLEPKARGNYIESFLFETKSGHCEFFATSMVIMLRTIGIPARIANGYYSVEWNNMSKAFTVRQRDAHSWVEVYFDDYGWMTFDPTPSTGVGRPMDSYAMVVAFRNLVDAMKLRWYRYIIDYSFSDQRGIIRSVLAAIDALRGLVQNLSLLSLGGGSGSEAGAIGIRAAWTAALGLGVLAIGAALLYGLVRLLMRLKGKHPMRRSLGTFVRFYSDILTQLERLGFQRHPGETPREFARRLSGEPTMAELAIITEDYYCVRYNAEQLSVEQQRRARQFLEQLRSVRRR